MTYEARISQRMEVKFFGALIVIAAIGYLLAFTDLGKKAIAAAYLVFFFG